MKNARAGMVRSWRGWMRRGLAACCLLPGVVLAQGRALVIDHRCTDIDQIPEAWIQKAARDFRVSYGHTSHGSQLIAGMRALQQADPARFAFGAGPGPRLSLMDNRPGGDLGNPDRTTWAQRTRDFLQGEGRDRNLVLWSWCGQAGGSEQDIQTYLDLMSGLEREFPKVRFVYMTGHLDGSGREGQLNQRNEQIRSYCRQHGKVLFDFADIESFDPDGRVNYMELQGRDSCDYRAGGATKNWAADWLARNPGHGLALPDSAAHTHPLNGALKGRAVWWMLARLAGWNGQPAAP